jgi:hypothetical protein
MPCLEEVAIMWIDLTAEEARVLETVLDSVLRERHHQVHHADSRDYRVLLEKEMDVIESLRTKLAVKSGAA